MNDPLKAPLNVPLNAPLGAPLNDASTDPPTDFPSTDFPNTDSPNTDPPTDALAECRAALAAAMDAGGWWPRRSTWTRQAMQELPRHLFAPDLVLHWDGRRYTAVDRRTDPRGWAELVHAGPGEAAVTQLAEGRPSSSLSCPAVVADMLDALMLEPGHRVLELGAGTGWNAALLAWRAGAGQVVSVEVDPGLAVAARGRLAAVRAEAAVVVGDGTAGCPARAPYDRVVCTYAVETVPWSWVAQTRPGGRIVTPWGRLGHVALTVSADGRSATGWVQGLATFMPARGTSPGRLLHQVHGDRPPRSRRRLERDPRPLHTDGNLLFALRVALPDVQVTTQDGDEDGLTVWLHDGDASWSRLRAPRTGPATVEQGGPHRLADALEDAWDQWLTDGAPTLYDFGMTVTEHSQYVWCRNADTGPRWPLPPQRAAADPRPVPSSAPSPSSPSSPPSSP
ncbi:methyltransferase domain-containing protein [Streptomyces sp. NPDC003077]|uniref:methyltransferase domain-containing protein n=1 Tax=Streptomyces sp. NPDC003077 TaxID=3154443 RepID=UPI0033BB9698